MRAVSIYMEANPNPNSMKFVVNFMLLQDGVSFDYPDKESAKDSPLAQQLFDLNGVERVFYMSNFITVTKSDDIEWLEIQDEIRGVIKPYLEEEKPLLLEELDKDPLFDENDSEVVKKIDIKGNERRESSIYRSREMVIQVIYFQCVLPYTWPV